MRVHVVQHVPFEGPGLIAQWAVARGHSLTAELALTEEFPNPGDVDLLVVMGGPMAADDEVGNPWLVAEKRFISAVIASGRPVLGVCLGSQILAEVLGGRVRRNEHVEIGWFPVELTAAGREEPLFAGWESPFVVGLWHGDNFDLPLGIEPVLASEACRNQAFVWDGRVVGLQFHIEWTQDALAELVRCCGAESAQTGPYVISAETLLAGLPRHLEAGRKKLYELLDRMTEVRA
ncbi:MAG: type 1 glutamine amidotransferase [Coriobacteriia bacterium]|nr:type 1 glutamine amidotransferase [Coriobacteriia bacterium]